MMPDVPAQLLEMRAITGMVESPGNADNPQILAMASYIGQRFPEMASYCANYKHDSIPWCGLTVAYCMARVGIRPQFGDGDDVNKFLWAQSWKQFGSAVDPDAAQQGDIVVFSGHVSLFEEFSGSIVKCRGGNQSDSIKVSSYARSSIDAVRRPPAASIAIQPAPQPSQDWASGKGSWYSQYDGRFHWHDGGDEPDSAALGCPDDAQGVSFYDHATLGKWFQVKAPNGTTSIEQQTDIGPAPWTKRAIDISAAAAERFGYSPQNFPTNGTFSWVQIDPPAVVAGLSPKNQAVKFRDWRKDHAVAEPTPAEPSPTSPPIPPTLIHPEIKLGATGAAVTELQKLLGIPQTGFFDFPTDTAVRNFQAAHNLDVDGEVGDQTWTVLIDPTKTPAKNLPSVVAAAGVDKGKFAQFIADHGDEARNLLSFGLAVLSAQHPDKAISLPSAPPPSTDPVSQRPSVAMGVLGTIASAVLAHPKVGAISVDTGVLSGILSLGTAALGMTGGWGKVASIALTALRPLGKALIERAQQK